MFPPHGLSTHSTQHTFYAHLVSSAILVWSAKVHPGNRPNSDWSFSCQVIIRRRALHAPHSEGCRIILSQRCRRSLNSGAAAAL